jgi:hypothetical protein
MPQNATLRRVLVGTTVALATAGLSTPASAQSRRPQRTQPVPTAPGQQAQPGQGVAPAQPTWDDLLPSPFLQRIQPKRWTVTAHMNIGASEWLEATEDGVIPKHDTWEFDAATLVYPLLGETASSILEVRGPADNEIPAVAGKVEFGDILVGDEVTVLKQGIGGGPLPSGTWRAQWQVRPSPAGSYTTREMEFEVAISQTCYQTKWVDEKAANLVEWPTGEWPPDAAATFQPQMFVDYDLQFRGYDMSPVTALLGSWAEGRTIEEMRKQSKPVVLAKWLAGQTLEHVQVNGEGLTFDRTGLWQGFDTPGAANAATNGRGTELDLPCLLVAIYRAVGLPARLVIGLDEKREGKQVYLDKREGGSAVRVWVEFALYDEANRTFGWIPVDITAMRHAQSRLPKNYLDNPVKYFGTHDELDRVAPLAFHFHPPTTVRSYGSPALWGWFVTPTPPGRATQTVRFNMTSTPRGGSDPSHLPADKQEPPRKP